MYNKIVLHLYWRDTTAALLWMTVQSHKCLRFFLRRVQNDNGIREGHEEVSSALYQQTTETLSHLNIPEFARRRETRELIFLLNF